MPFANINIRYKISRSVPKRVYKTWTQFEGNTYTLDYVIDRYMFRKTNRVIDSRDRIYSIDFRNQIPVLVDPLQIPLSFNSTEFLLGTIGWDNLPYAKQMEIIQRSYTVPSGCIHLLDAIMNSDHSFDKDWFKHNPKHIIYKCRKQLLDKKHWIWSELDNHPWHLIQYANQCIIDVKKSDPIIGYKAFYINHDNGTLSCRGYKFDVEKIHKEKIAIPCNMGFHFCRVKKDINLYYELSSKNVVVYKVQAWGTVISEETKSVCTNIQLISQVPNFG